MRVRQTVLVYCNKISSQNAQKLAILSSKIEKIKFRGRGHRITTGPITGKKQIFHERNTNVTSASWEQCSRLQQSRWYRYWFFCCVHRSRTTPKLPLPLGRSRPLPSTWFHGAIEYPTKRHLDRFSRFSGLINVTNRHLPPVKRGTPPHHTLPLGRLRHLIPRARHNSSPTF